MENDAKGEVFTTSVATTSLGLGLEVEIAGDKVHFRHGYGWSVRVDYFHFIKGLSFIWIELLEKMFQEVGFCSF